MGTGTEKFRKPVKDKEHFESEWDRIFGKGRKDERNTEKTDTAIAGQRTS